MDVLRVAEAVEHPPILCDKYELACELACRKLWHRFIDLCAYLLQTGGRGSRKKLNRARTFSERRMGHSAIVDAEIGILSTTNSRGDRSCLHSASMRYKELSDFAVPS